MAKAGCSGKFLRLSTGKARVQGKASRYKERLILHWIMKELAIGGCNARSDV